MKYPHVCCLRLIDENSPAGLGDSFGQVGSPCMAFVLPWFPGRARERVKARPLVVYGSIRLVMLTPHFLKTQSASAYIALKISSI